jgi:meso-butanediol dehydrogenase/(S,S)-butanediol dehydrogenase/diacetyl reductase
MGSFIGKTVIVTGAASGIGAATAKRFSDNGAKVVALDLDRERTAATLAELPAERTLVTACDVASKENVREAVAAALVRFGRIDVLVNNAGIGGRGEVEETSEADWNLLFSVNVSGCFNMAKAVMPELRKTRGSIVQTSSIAGLGGSWGSAAYNASKGAITNLTRAMALDCGKYGVRVNAVNPGLIATNMTGMFDEQLLEKVKDRTPLGRIGDPDDVAAVIMFLASDDARFVTGVNLPVDGGVSASSGMPRH